jgi:RNA polymerase sigma-70 factor (ECF subfamily)
MDLSRLVREARHGSAAAQKCLFDLLSDQMMMLCRRYVKNRENAEEILLDGFYKLFRGLADFQFAGENQFYAWVKKIMVNECLMFLRKKNVFNLVAEATAEDLALEESGLDRLSAAEIFSLILQLPVGYRTVFNLYAVEGMNHREIAGLLGVSEGTSKSQLSKARSLLQKKISQNENDYVRRKTK